MSRREPKDWLRTSNPTMNENVFVGAEVLDRDARPMTISGTVGKTGILLALLLPTAVVGWMYPTMAGMIASIAVAFVLALVIAFKPTTAPSLAPAYSVVKGYFVGSFSFIIAASLAKTQYAAAVPIAVSASIVTLGVMLALYAGRIIRVTETMRSVIIGLTMAVMLLYLFSFIMSFAAPGLVQGISLFKSGPVGIIFSVFVIGLAAFNFLLDFDIIERGAEAGAPKYMEWYGAFGIMVTLIWLYIEILRLLVKLANNR